MSYLETHSEEIERLGLPIGIEDMSRLIEQYPWFTTARVIVSVERRKSDPTLEMYLTTHPCPTSMLKGVVEPKNDEKIENETSSIELIDAFLSAEHRSIRPNDATPEHNVAEKSAVIQLDGEIVTEELAQIYMSQGLTQQAEEIYIKLKERKATKKE